MASAKNETKILIDLLSGDQEAKSKLRVFRDAIGAFDHTLQYALNAPWLAHLYGVINIGAWRRFQLGNGVDIESISADELINSVANILSVAPGEICNDITVTAPITTIVAALLKLAGGSIGKYTVVVSHEPLRVRVGGITVAVGSRLEYILHGEPVEYSKLIGGCHG